MQHGVCYERAATPARAFSDASLSNLTAHGNRSPQLSGLAPERSYAAARSASTELAAEVTAQRPIAEAGIENTWRVIHSPAPARHFLAFVFLLQSGPPPPSSGSLVSPVPSVWPS